LRRSPDENGIRVWVEGLPGSEKSRSDALRLFRVALGLLRARHREAGELREEQGGGLGAGSSRDAEGNQSLLLGQARLISDIGGSFDHLIRAAESSLAASKNLGGALEVNGRPNRDAADYYLIYEFAEAEFGGSTGIGGKLGILEASQERFTRSANNLPAVDGGRHATNNSNAPMDLAAMDDFIRGLLQAWVGASGGEDGGLPLVQVPLRSVAAPDLGGEESS
jgi:hypothetical protein